jgi:hypothetical protein
MKLVGIVVARSTVAEALPDAVARCTLTMLGVKGNQVRVDVDAPQEIEVHR